MPDPIIEPVAPEPDAPPAPEPDAPAAPTPGPAEVSARAMGWKPKEEYSGPEGKWVDAGEFVRRKPLFDELHDVKRTVKKMAETNDAMARHFQKQVTAAVEARLAQLNVGRDAAILEGDVAKVREFDKAIDAQKATRAEAAAPQGDPEVSAWVEANEWYRTDKEMHEFAQAFNEAHLRSNPTATTAGALDATLKAVKLAFPDKFETAKPATPPAAPVASGAPANTGAKKYTLSRLNKDQRLAHDQYIKSGTFDKAAKAAGITPTEYYMKSLEEIGDLA